MSTESLLFTLTTFVSWDLAYTDELGYGVPSLMCKIRHPGLSARWAFSPLHLMASLYLIFHIKLDTLNNSPNVW